MISYDPVTMLFPSKRSLCMELNAQLDVLSLWLVWMTKIAFKVVTGYGLDDRCARVRFPAWAGNFSLLHRVHNGSGAHLASYPTGTGGSFPRDKATGAWSWPLASIWCWG